MAHEGPDPRFGRVAILGVGFMGGSLARALRALPAPPDVVGWSIDPEEVEAGLAAGALTGAATDATDAARGADLVVLATPLAAACDLVEVLADVLGRDTLLTDVASLKGPVREAVRRAGRGLRWVGSHPMCGGERSGFAASRAELYRGARIWLVVDDSAPADGIRLEAFWTELGGRPARITSGEHDARMALASHLPQLTSTTLARLLAAEGLSREELGPGGLDMTRLAGSSPLLWRDLLAHAPPTLPEALRRLAVEVGSMAELLEVGDLDEVEAWMAATRRWKERS